MSRWLVRFVLAGFMFWAAACGGDEPEPGGQGGAGGTDATGGTGGSGGAGGVGGGGGGPVAEGPAILSFDASPSVADEGEPVTLSWRTERTESIRITSASGETVDVSDQNTFEGAVLVLPEGSTTYTLEAFGVGETVTSSVGVELRDSPTAALQSSDERVRWGDEITLTWTASDAENVRIERDGMFVVDTDELEGTFVEQPNLTNEYRLVATRGVLTAYASVQVEVEPVFLELGATDLPTAVGDPVVVSWQVGGATSIVVTNLEGFEEVIEVESPAEGTLLVPMGEQGRFQLIARSGDIETIEEVLVPVLRAPQVGEFSVRDDILSANPGETATAILQWTEVERAHELSLEADTLGPVDIAGANFEQGEVAVSVEEDTTFTLTASNAAGEATAMATVQVVPFPSIGSLQSSQSHVGAMEAFTLSWETGDATAIEIEANGLPLSGVDPHLTWGSTTVQVAADTLFTLRAFNRAMDFVEETVSVTVGAPMVLDFAVSASYVPVGFPFDFEWQNLGGSSLELRDGLGTLICSTTNPDEIADGGCTTQVGTEGEHAFTLTVTNGVGDETTSALTVLANDGPMILAFSLTPDEITEGDSITFTWEVVDDPLGNAPTLTLSDGTTDYDLSGANVNQGSQAFPVETVGALSFTFTATTSEGSKSEAATATVHGNPAVTLVASPTEYDLQTPVTLSWTSEHAAALTLSALDGAGAPITPPLLVVPEADREAGSFAVTPGGATTYQIVAVNGLGVEASAEASVTVVPPEVLTFDAAPPEVVAGDEVTLSWTTSAATEVALSLFDGMAVTEATEPFIDISQTGAEVTITAQCGSHGAADEGCGDITFPQGFTFPFGGIERTEARVMVNGHLGFDMSFTDNSYTNAALPSTSGRGGNAHLAPLWDDLNMSSTSAIHYEFSSDARGDLLVVQWTEFGFLSGTSDMNFQVIMWEDGGFDFRYGNMTGSNQSRVDGNSATIGYQTPSEDEYHQITYDTAVEGGLSHRGWSFRHVHLDLNGNYSFPASSDVTDVTLVATGPGGEDTAQVSLTVHPRAGLVVTAPTHELEAGDDFSLGWTTTDATAVEVHDAAGVRCVADPADVGGGACTLSEASPGVYTYTVRATGALGHVVEEEVELQVFIPFELVAFAVSEEEAVYGDSITLSWDAPGGVTASLLANDQEIFPAGAAADLGTATFGPLQEETTFVFTVESADGREATATRVVEVRTFDFELTADADTVVPGTPVTISWDVTSFTGGTPVVDSGPVPMEEVDLTQEPGAAFFDISTTGTPLSLTSYHAAIDLSSEGFSFPFGGASYSQFKLGRSGYITFDMNLTAWNYNNTELPSTTTSGQHAHLAANWGDLGTTGVGYHYQHFSDPAGDYVIVQWTGATHDSGPQDMNFQIVLFEDGTFEYRYGDMLPADDIEANGRRKTIGFQTPHGEGWQFHFGGGWLSSSVGDPVDGGLSHRTLRSGTSSGTTMVVTPEDTTDYTICVSLDGFSECKTITIEAPWEILSFEASSDSVAPPETVTLTWETRGADSVELTADGVVLATDLTGSYIASPTENTTYTLTMDSLGRTKSESVSVEFRTFSLDVQATPASGFAGDTVTVSWNATSLVGGDPVLFVPPVEVDAATSPYVDISSDPGAVEVIGSGADTTMANHSFTSGFVFPYDGDDRSEVRISTDGFISFETTGGTVTTNTTLPNSGSSQRRVHIAAFWDDLDTRSSGRVHVLETAAGSAVVQWSGISKYTGSSNANEYDLNFQVELFTDGSFEIRYGTMDAGDATSSSCYPTNDCVGDANGGSATIGYQSTSGQMGHLLHFGGSYQSSTQQPFAGGLSNRTFLVDPALTGSFQRTLDETETFTVCGSLGDYSVCEEITVVVPVPGDILITEVMVDPVPGAPQWIELRNMTSADISLDGWSLETTTASFSLPAWASIPAEGYLLLSNGPGVGFQEDVNLGAHLQLDPQEDSVSLVAGAATIANMSWDSSWTFPQGQSYEVIASFQQPEVWSFDSQALFCATAESYDGVSYGTPGSLGPECAPQPTTMYSVDPNGSMPLFDIESTGTTLFSTYETQASLSLGFSFPFFGETTEEIWVTSTGFASIGQSTFQATNQPLPLVDEAPAPAGIIAPFWEYFSYSTSPAGHVAWEERTVAGQQVMVVEWVRMKLWNETSNRLSFQMQLWEDGTIVFGYRDFVGTASRLSGTEATIGIQQAGGLEFVQHSHHEAAVSENQVIVFTPIP